MSGDELVLEEARDEFGLDDLIEHEEKAESEAEALESEPSNDELERARQFAEKLNTGFLFGVNKLVCPSVENIDDLIDRDAGTEALTPLAMEMGGEVPSWMLALQEKYGPWIKAGIYMGSTIYTLKQVEKINQANAEEDKKDSQGGDDGKE